MTEGCLISIFRYETGSGGRGMTLALEMRRGGPAVQAAEGSRRTGRAPPGPVMAGRKDRSQVRTLKPGPIAVDRRPSNSQGEAGCLKWEVHRGRCGANLQHRARDALGMADLRRPAERRAIRYASVPRGAEACGSVRTLGVPRALGIFESGRLVAPKPEGRRRTEMEMRLTPGRAKNRGDGAWLKWFFGTSGALHGMRQKTTNRALRRCRVFGYIRALPGRGEAPSKRPSSTLLAPGGSVPSARHFQI